MTSATRIGYLTSKKATTFSSVALATVCVVLAVVCGLIATTGNFIAVAVVVGILLGGLLLARLDLAVWLVLIGTLLVNGAVGLVFPSMTKVAWLFSMLGFFLMIGTVLSKLGAPDRKHAMPGFIAVLLLMMCVSVCLSFAGNGTFFEILAGGKRAFQLWGLMLAIAMMPVNLLSRDRIQAWLKFLFLVGLLQLPAALFERLVLVPKRIGMGNGVVPIDIVAGTFEVSLDGGGSSSIMVMFLSILLAYVFSAWKEKIISTKKMLGYVVVLAAPMFLGETKSVIILLPVMFILVFSTELRRNPIKAVGAVLVGFFFTSVLAWLYLSMMLTGSITIEQRLQGMIDYNFGSVGYYDRYSVNRTTAITFWYEQHGLQIPVETVFGHGIGSSYSGTGTLAQGHLNQRYPFMSINLTGLSTLLWDTGLLGTSMFVAALLAAWRKSTSLLRSAAGDKRAQLMALRFSLFCIVFSLLYSNSMFTTLSHETIISVTLGYLAWLVRATQNSTIGARADI